jgi:hypothetical protein
MVSPGYYTPKKESPLHIIRGLGGPWSRADVSEKRKISYVFET